MTGLETYEKDGQTRQVVLAKVPHSFEDGTCTMCGYEAVTIVMRHHQVHMDLLIVMELIHRIIKVYNLHQLMLQ